MNVVFTQLMKQTFTQYLCFETLDFESKVSATFQNLLLVINEHWTGLIEIHIISLIHSCNAFILLITFILFRLINSHNWHTVVFSVFLQVSYGANSFYLSDKKKYPLFFRTIPPEEGQNRARLAVLKYFKWNRIAVLTEKEPYYEAVSNIRLLCC